MARKTALCTCPPDGALVFLGHLRDCPEVAEPEVTIPLAAYRRLVAVAEYVSLGRRYVGVEPYPDATARMALGALPERTENV